MKSTQSTKTKWKIPMIGVTVKTLVIVIGAVLACTAPFFHMAFPKKSENIILLEHQLKKGEITEDTFDKQLPLLKKEQKVFGFSTARRFWYALGLPCTVFFFAMLFIYASNAIGDIELRKAIRLSSYILFYISVYQIIWVLWPGSDLPKNLYHLSIGLMSISAVGIALLIRRFRMSLQRRIEILVHFISIDAYKKYINKDDQPSYMKDSYDIYDEIT